LFGESAGATSVVALCASPLARGLFAGAIAQSSWLTPDNALPLRATEGQASAESAGVAMANHLISEGPTTLEGLRAIPADELWRKLGQSFQPTMVIDGKFLVDHPEEVFLAGAQHDIPFLAGTTADEGTAFLSLFPLRSAVDYQEWVEEDFGEWADAILDSYPVGNLQQLRDQVSRLIGDRWFVRGTRAVLRGMAGVPSPAWQYEFTLNSPFVPAMGAHHALELGYVFGSLDPATARPIDLSLATTLQAYWVQFARTGDPNHKDLPEWPVFENEKEHYLKLGETLELGQRLREETCDLLDEIRDALP
jgi:para-nitrobenzyl esterase